MKLDDDHGQLVDLAEKLLEITNFFALQLKDKTKHLSKFQRAQLLSLIVSRLTDSVSDDESSVIFYAFSEAVALSMHSSGIPEQRWEILINAFSKNIKAALEGLKHSQENHDKDCPHCSKKKH